MPVFNALEVEALLDEGKEPDLLGTREQPWLDFKVSPYVLDTARQKWELAKDIAALARLPAGGCIVMGVRTTPDPDDFEDVAAEIVSFPCGMVNEAQYREIIQRNVYPPVKNIRIRVFRREDDKCLAIVVVPPQDPDDQPFLLNRVISEEGREIANSFALPVRDGAHTAWEPIGQVHRDLADGRRSRRASPPAVEPQPAVLPTDVTVATLRDRATQLEAYMGWEDHPTLMLAAWPERQVERISHFNDEAGIRGKFEDPPQLRDAGFGIGWRAVARQEGGALVASDGHRIRWLEPDGAFFVAATADQEFLCRTSARDSTPRPLPVNHVVLTEFTFLFCVFQSEVLSEAVDGNWHLGLVVIGASSRPWKLLLGPRANHVFRDELRTPSQDTWSGTFTSSPDASANAYQLIARFYDLFGAGENLIPFSANDRIDPEAIRALSR